MRRCKICKVPLDGILGKIAGFIFGVRPSSKESQICNKCIGIEPSMQEDKNASALPKDGVISKEEIYNCQICKRMIHSEHALEHVKAEEYIMQLILKDHPQWQHKGPTCKECIDYYRKLVTETEI